MLADTRRGSQLICRRTRRKLGYTVAVGGVEVTGRAARRDLRSPPVSGMDSAAPIP
jgi:hypothetical protein